MRTHLTTFVLVAEEVLRGPAASIPVALTEAGAGVEGPLRDPRRAARPRPPDRGVGADWGSLEAGRRRVGGVTRVGGPELGEQIGAPRPELLLDRA